MKWLAVICLLILAGCQLEQGQPVNLDPVIEAVAPVAVQIFVPEPWRTIAWALLAALGGGVIGRKIKK